MTKRDFFPASCNLRVSFFQTSVSRRCLPVPLPCTCTSLCGQTSGRAAVDMQDISHPQGLLIHPRGEYLTNFYMLAYLGSVVIFESCSKESLPLVIASRNFSCSLTSQSNRSYSCRLQSVHSNKCPLSCAQLEYTHNRAYARC